MIQKYLIVNYITYISKGNNQFDVWKNEEIAMTELNKYKKENQISGYKAYLNFTEKDPYSIIPFLNLLTDGGLVCVGKSRNINSLIL